MNSKLRTILKSTLITVLLVIVVVMAAATWYTNTYSMKPAMPREINDPKLGVRILIATQGSEFKDSVVSRVIDRLKGRPIYIKVIDVTGLKTVDPANWAAIVIIHTWEAGMAPKVVSDFVKKNNTSGLIILTTSGDGRNHIEGVDGITSASNPSEIDRCVREILMRIEMMIAPSEISAKNQSLRYDKRKK